MAAANAQIGVAKAAYYPNISLGATGGFESGVITTLLSGPSILWSVWRVAIAPIFDAGRRRPTRIKPSLPTTRPSPTTAKTVLTGFQQVEDNLAGTSYSREGKRTHNSVPSSLLKNTWSWPSLAIEAYNELSGSDDSTECSPHRRGYRGQYSRPPDDQCRLPDPSARRRLGSLLLAGTP